MAAHRSIPPVEVSLCHIACPRAGFVRFQSVILKGRMTLQKVTEHAPSAGL
jgi:hypothetical protein